MKIILTENQKNILLEAFDKTKWTCSQNGINFILKREKFSPYAYPDGSKQYSIGYGHKILERDGEEGQRWIYAAKHGDERPQITKERATEMFKVDLQLHINDLTRVMYRYLKDDYINGDLYPQGFKDAVISLMYNCGQTVFTGTPFFIKWMEVAKPSNNNTSIFFYKNGRYYINKQVYNQLISTIKESAKTIVGSGGIKSDELERRRLGEFAMANVYGAR